MTRQILGAHVDRDAALPGAWRHPLLQVESGRLKVDEQAGTVEAQRLSLTYRYGEVPGKFEVELNQPIARNELDARLVIGEVPDHDVDVVTNLRKFPSPFAFFRRNHHARAEQMPLWMPDHHPHTGCALEAFECVPKSSPGTGEKCAEQSAITRGRRFQFDARSHCGTWPLPRAYHLCMWHPEPNLGLPATHRKYRPRAISMAPRGSPCGSQPAFLAISSSLRTRAGGTLQRYSPDFLKFASLSLRRRSA